jgi:hypothetical protein
MAGAMMLCRAQRDIAPFDRAARQLGMLVEHAAALK